MGFRNMAEVMDWDLDTNEKLVAFSLANAADDHTGENCFPSIDRVAYETGYTYRSIQRVLRKLMDRGILEEVGWPPDVADNPKYKFYADSGVTRYRLNLDAAPKLPPFPEWRKTNGRAATRGGRQDDAPTGGATSATEGGDKRRAEGATNSTKGGDNMTPNHINNPIPEPYPETKGDEASRHVMQGSMFDTAKPKPERPRDPLWDTLVELMGYQPTTKPERGRWNAFLKAVRDSGCGPRDIAERWFLYLQHYPDAALTVAGLMNQWDWLGGRLARMAAPEKRQLVTKMEQVGWDDAFLAAAEQSLNATTRGLTEGNPE